MKRFIPFHKIKNQQVVVVDGLHPNNLVLSHWKGANTHLDIQADTSGEIVLNAIERNFEGLKEAHVSATHFDIDGFVGIFALFNPRLAIQYKDALIQMAIIGDFREYSPNSEDAELALKLCCWMNIMEKKLFYRPFEEVNEIEECPKKFYYFLNKFPSVLENSNDFIDDWEVEYKKVKDGLALLEKGTVHREPNIGLIVKKVKQPIHYYALFSETNNFDIVMSIYDKNRYEVEFKYTTWVDIVSRSTFPRISLKRLVSELNKLEKSKFIWNVDHITDTGPILRLEENKTTKADRYANPYERAIFSSSITNDEFQTKVIHFLEEKYAEIEPKKAWTWKEMKQL